MKKSPVSPSVYAYNDFRKFLSDYQQERQKQRKEFSKSEFSRLLQLPNTRSYFTDVLKGKRVTDTFVERFITVIGFSHDEAQFFRTLVQLNQAETAEARELAFDQLIALNRTPRRILDKNVLSYYGKWYHGVVRALLALEDFSDDYQVLARKINPPITPLQAKKAVELLLDLGLVQRNVHGVCKPVDTAIAAPEKVKDDLIRHFQLECIGLAGKAMVNVPDSVSFSMTNTISISEQGHQRLMRLLEKFRSQVQSLVHKDEDKADRVMQLNVVYHKVTK